MRSTAGGPSRSAELNQALALSPNQGEVLFLLGQIYRRLGKMEDAKKVYLRAVNTPNPKAKYELALVQVYDALGDIDEKYKHRTAFRALAVKEQPCYADWLLPDFEKKANVIVFTAK